MMLLKIRRVANRKGVINVSGAKNSALPIICASLISDGDIILENVPNIVDVTTLFSILRKLGYNVAFANNRAIIKRKKRTPYKILGEDVKKMRGSYYFMGALLSKRKKIMIANSGGCNLGNRPINYHLEGFKKMGAEIKEEKDITTIKAKELCPATITLPFPSVGATINLMLAAIKTKGITTINNSAKEPEIVDVANFLNSMGAKVFGAGTSSITINGVEKLTSSHYHIMPDRIEAGTYLILGAMLDGAEINGINGKYLYSLISLLRKSGFHIFASNNQITIDKEKSPNVINITIGPYPAFPTDLGQPLAVLATQIKGTSIIKETIFTNRYSHIKELNKMGAKINVVDNQVIIDGTTKLNNAHLKAYDLRGAASLVLAASLNENYSTIENIHPFLRGYEKPVEKLANFGIEAQLIRNEN